jgi:hypothetical protein
MEASMKSSVLWALVGLNAVLLFMFTGQFNHVKTAEAQIRRPADYLLIPGSLSTGGQSVVYIIDSTNGQLGGMAYNDGSHTLDTMPSINLTALYNSAVRR